MGPPGSVWTVCLKISDVGGKAGWLKAKLNSLLAKLQLVIDFGQ